MKLLKKFWYKLYFNKKAGKVMAIGTKMMCEKCPIRNKVNAPMEATPPHIEGLIVCDLDQALPSFKGKKPSEVVEAHAEVLIYEPKEK